MEKEKIEVTEAFLNDLRELQCRTINEICVIADGHGMNRDEVLANFAIVMIEISEIGTLKEYQITNKNV